MTLRPPIEATKVKHDSTRRSLAITVHAPHWPWSQPFLLPVVAQGVKQRRADVECKVISLSIDVDGRRMGSVKVRHCRRSRIRRRLIKKADGHGGHHRGRWWIESNVWCPRAAAAMILSGLAFHRNGFGSVLWSSTYLLMAACRSTMPTKVPRLRRRLVSTAKKPSTAFSHEALVAVKWKVTRGWRASQAITLGCLWAA